jgi:integrase
MARGRGRPARYVIGRDRRPVVGLSQEKASRRYYATHSRPRKYFGTDLDQAVMKYRRWQASHREARTILLPNLQPFLPKTDQDAAVAEGWITKEEAQKLVPWPADVPEDAFYAECRELILKNPARFAERVGIPEIGFLQDLRPPEKSLTLTSIGELYVGKKRRISTHWKRKQSRYWEEFRKAVGVKTVREIEIEDLRRYHDKVWSDAETSDLSPTYISHRLQAVRTILRHALKQGRDQEQLRRVLDLSAIFELPKKNGANPCPIRPEDFHKLLDVSPPKWRAILLLSLNAALYPSEVAAVKKSNIDLTARTMTMRRGKTGVARIACLWDRTVQAIREYQKAEPHQSEFVFVNMNGVPYDANHVTRNYRRRREAAELPVGVTFDQIRDGSYTSAVESGCDLTEAKALAGHRTGIADHYLLRRPTLVRNACAAIERAYFGSADR